MRQARDQRRLFGFLRHGQHTREIAARRLVVVAGVGVAERLLRLLESRLRAGVVADHVERGSNLRTGERARDLLKLVVVEIAETRLVHAAGLGQNIGRVGHGTIHHRFRGVVVPAAFIDFEVIAR